jgi:hypothetical protein
MHARLGGGMASTKSPWTCAQSKNESAPFFDAQENLEVAEEDATAAGAAAGAAAADEGIDRTSPMETGDDRLELRKTQGRREQWQAMVVKGRIERTAARAAHVRRDPILGRLAGPLARLPRPPPSCGSASCPSRARTPPAAASSRGACLGRSYLPAAAAFPACLHPKAASPRMVSSLFIPLLRSRVVDDVFLHASLQWTLHPITRSQFAAC